MIRKGRGGYKYAKVLFGRKEGFHLSPFYPGYFHLSNALNGLRKVRGKVLDVGCGQGASTKVIKGYRPDLKVWGIDVSVLSLKEAKKDASGVKFLFGSAYKIPFKDGAFDAVFSFDTLEHLSFPGRALKEVKRVLKPTGTLILSCPTEGNLTTLHGILWRVFGLNLKRKHVGHVQMYTLGQLRKLFDAHGFRIVKVSWSNYLYNQTVDLSYFLLLHLLGKKPEERLSQINSPKSFSRLATFINFLESSFFFFLPGQTVHLIAKKD